MAVNEQVIQGVQASVALVLILSSSGILVSAPEALLNRIDHDKLINHSIQSEDMLTFIHIIVFSLKQKSLKLCSTGSCFHNTSTKCYAEYPEESLLVFNYEAFF